MAHPDPVLMRNLILVRLCETNSNPGWMGMQDWLQITRGICPFIDNGVSDHLVITSTTDTTAPGGLIQKLAAGTGISLTEVLQGGINKVLITNTAPGTIDDHLVIASGGTGTDTPGSLINKIYAGSGISISTVVDGGVTKISVTNTAPGTIDDHLVKSSNTDATAVGGLIQKTYQSGGTVLTEYADPADGNIKKLKIHSLAGSTNDPLPNGIADPGDGPDVSFDDHVHPVIEPIGLTFYLPVGEDLLSPNVPLGPATIEPFTVTAGSVNLLLEQHRTDVGVPGKIIWPEGPYQATIWASSDDPSGNTSISVDIYSRSALGVDVFRGTLGSIPVTSATPVAHVLTATLPLAALANVTDRFELQILSSNADIVDHEVSIYRGSSLRLSRVLSTIKTITSAPALINLGGPDINASTTPKVGRSIFLDLGKYPVYSSSRLRCVAYVQSGAQGIVQLYNLTDNETVGLLTFTEAVPTVKELALVAGSFPFLLQSMKMYELRFYLAFAGTDFMFCLGSADLEIT